MRRVRIAALVVVMALSLSGCMNNPYKDGVKALENGEYKEAAADFTEAIELEKQTADAYRGLGIALWETEDYEGAKDAFQKALKAGTEKNGTIYNLLGCCEMKLSNEKEAAEAFEKGLKDKEISAELKQEMRLNQIVAYEKMGNLDTAKTLLSEYLTDYPDDEKAAKEAQFLETR